MCFYPLETQKGKAKVNNSKLCHVQANSFPQSAMNDILPSQLQNAKATWRTIPSSHFHTKETNAEGIFLNPSKHKLLADKVTTTTMCLTDGHTCRKDKTCAVRVAADTLFSGTDSGK